jgi:hypothetical protein
MDCKIIGLAGCFSGSVFHGLAWKTHQSLRTGVNSQFERISGGIGWRGRKELGGFGT